MLEIDLNRCHMKGGWSSSAVQDCRVMTKLIRKVKLVRVGVILTPPPFPADSTASGPEKYVQEEDNEFSFSPPPLRQFNIILIGFDCGAHFKKRVYFYRCLIRFNYYNLSTIIIAKYRTNICDLFICINILCWFIIAPIDLFLYCQAKCNLDY